MGCAVRAPCGAIRFAIAPYACWKYRVGDYRIIASIEDSALRILVVRVGNRWEVYRT